MQPQTRTRLVGAAAIGAITGAAYLPWSQLAGDLTAIAPRVGGQPSPWWALAPAFTALIVVVLRGRHYRRKGMPWTPAPDLGVGICVAALLTVVGVLVLGSTSSSLLVVLAVALVAAGVAWVVQPTVLAARAGWTGRTPVPGEIWWADVPFQDLRDSKDRPCLVVAVNSHGADVLSITSQNQSSRDGYLPLPVTWSGGKNLTWSWLQLHPTRHLPVTNFRRYAGTCAPNVWAQIGGRQRAGSR